MIARECPFEVRVRQRPSTGGSRRNADVYLVAFDLTRFPNLAT